jgi:hypothetical protein
MDYNCAYCNISFKRNCDLTRHINSQKCKDNKVKYEKDNKVKEKLFIIEKELLLYKNREIDYINKIKLLEQNIIDIQSIKKEIEDKDKLIKSLQEKAEEYRKIVEKAATKTIVKNNYTHNNYLNYISSEPLKLSEIQNKIKDIVTTKTMMWDDADFNNHIVNNILKDDDGKDKVLCTDINRKNFSYKDENSGELISDPELERLTDQLRKGADVKSLKRDLLEKLIKKYEDSGVDPYKKFYDMLQKLEFGSPFVDHVAKKTYVKTKSGNDKHDDGQHDEII